MKKKILFSLDNNSKKIFTYGKDKEWTYGNLKDFIIYFSNYIKNNNIKKVVITLPNGFYAYAIIITCYLSGVTYCVINEDNPIERRLYIYSTFKPDLIISNVDDNDFTVNLVNLMDELKKYHNKNEIYLSNTPIIYISFTSGTTGQPKGCMIRTEAVEKHIECDLKIFDFRTNDVIGQYVPLHFDMSVLDIYCSVMVGASLVEFGDVDRLKPAILIKKYNITFLNIVPQVIDILINSAGLNEKTLNSVRMIRFGGDKVYKSTAKLLLNIKAELRIVSTYGPTEATMFSTYCIIDQNNIDRMSTSILSIGTPISGSKVDLYNIQNGVGEMVVCGDYVGAGYLGDEQGGYKILKIDNHEQCVYFTGDYAKKIEGLLFFEGRKDQQIKKMVIE